MLYFIYGEDSYRSRKKIREIIANLTERDPTATMHRLDSENANEEKISDLISGQNLFGHKSVTVFDGVFESELADFLSARVKEMAEPRNVYIILEKKPDTKLVKSISKYASKVSKLDKLSAVKTKEWLINEAAERGLKLSEQEIGFLSSNFAADLWAISQALELKSLGGGIDVRKFLYNPFGLADLFASKKKPEAFRHFHDNLNAGVAAEEMFWRLWWQARVLLAVLSCKEAGLNDFQIKKATGLHPFVVRKSLSALSNYSREELESIWENLFLLWRDSRSGKTELGGGIERLILGLG